MSYMPRGWSVLFPNGIDKYYRTLIMRGRTNSSRKASSGVRMDGDIDSDQTTNGLVIVIVVHEDTESDEQSCM